VVVAFAWSREGYARHAQFALPTAVYPELTTDVPAAIDSPVDAFRLSASLIAPPAGMVDPSAFIAQAAGIDPGNALQARADAIHKSARGNVFTPADGKSTPLKDLKPEAFWKSLNEGATWFGEEGELLTRRRGHAEFLTGLPQEVPPRLRVSASESFPLVVALSAPRAASLSSPLMSKLYQDSDLRLPPNTVVLPPDAACALGLQDASRAILHTQYGTCPVALVQDPAVPPGMLEVSPGPEVLDICGAFTRAKVAPV
jgi:anaerobic selenocysteine-containing dehydrogenase